MRALLINAVCGIRSTGRICIELAKELEEQGYDNSDAEQETNEART